MNQRAISIMLGLILAATAAGGLWWASDAAHAGVSAAARRGGIRGTVPPTDAISREFTIFRGEDPPAARDALSREFSIFRGEDPPVFRDAIGREFSIFRGSEVVPPILDAISREFTISVTPCMGDANGDRIVNFSDVSAVLANWGQSYLPKPAGGPGDANGDATVNFMDITAVLSNWGVMCP